jgi:uncharacterized protein YjbI with pentapeptide repeats
MASQQNKPQKSSGSNDSNNNRSSNKSGEPTNSANDAANVDWMIISDFSTRIGLDSSTKLSSTPAPSDQPSPAPNAVISEDLEDLEWLQSIGLDDEILPTPSPTTPSPHASGLNASVKAGTSSHSHTVENIKNVENIDWLIVSDLKTRIDDSQGQRQSLATDSQNDFADFADLEDGFDFNLDFDDNVNSDVNHNLDVEDFNFLNNEFNNDFNPANTNLEELGEEIEFANLTDQIDQLDADPQFDGHSDESLQEVLDELDTIGKGIDDADLEQSLIDVVDGMDDVAIAQSLDWEDSSPITDLSADMEMGNDGSDDLGLAIDANEQGGSFDDDLVDQLDQLDEFDQVDVLGESLDSEIDSFDDLQINDEISSELDDLDNLNDLINDSNDLEPVDFGKVDTLAVSHEDAFAPDWESSIDHSIDDSVWDSDPLANDLSAQTSEQDFADPFAGEQEISTNFAQDLDVPVDDVFSWSEATATDMVEHGWEADFDQVSDAASLSDQPFSDRFPESVSDSLTEQSQLDKAEPYAPTMDMGELENALANDLIDEEDWQNQEVLENENRDTSFDTDLHKDIAQVEEDKNFDDINHEMTTDYDLSMTTDKDLSMSSSGVSAQDEVEYFEGVLDEGFDLEAFDEDSILPLTESAAPNIVTALTPSRKDEAINKPEIDPFEEQLAGEVLRDRQTSEIDFMQNAASYDVLGDIATDSHDYLDSFELEDIAIGDQMSSAAPMIPTPPPPILPHEPVPPPVMPRAAMPLPPKPTELTLPTAGRETTKGSVPMGLPPLPPKRQQPSTPQSPQPMPPQKTRPAINESDFESFHKQPHHLTNNQDIDIVDQGWTDLLDAETVISGMLPSPLSGGDSRGSLPPNAGGRANSMPASSEQAKSRRNRSSPSRNTGLPSFDDLSLEVHDDNTDWSGLLESGDLSDSITTISNVNTPISSRKPRADMTSVSETREIPRDRRMPISRIEETQSRMSAPPDQLDFNRFTEASYDSYDEYAAALENSPPVPVTKEPKLKMPSISIESLWQDYLKFPVIGLGAIGGAFLLYNVASRPIFDLGLRFGLFKDARGMDFTKADFTGARLSGVDFSRAILTNAKMQDADLTGANFQDANLNGTDFANADMSRARLVGASVIWSNFTNTQMNLVDFTGANLTRSNFMSAKMNGANLRSTKIGAIGTENATKFSPTVLLAWQIVNESREGRNLSGQDLSTLNLSSANLRRANLTNVKLNYTDMSGANLSGANLNGAQVNGTNWNDAKLNGANLSGMRIDPKQLPRTNSNTICPNNRPGPCKF